MLVVVADRLNIFLVQGMHRPDRIDHRIFLRGRLWAISTDMVRQATVELISREIAQNGVGGAVAEVGVYQGDFAVTISHAFPDRTLHLFDTFEGFDESDVSIDTDRGYGDFPNRFKTTTTDLVLSKLPHPEKAMLHKGWFPDSATGSEEETFCFVSLDVDLSQPTSAALEWFYPRLEPGGFMMIHDYNNSQYRGVKEALRRFSAEAGVGFAVLPDAGGTAVITKAIRPQSG